MYAGKLMKFNEDQRLGKHKVVLKNNLIITIVIETIVDKWCTSSKIVKYMTRLLLTLAPAWLALDTFWLTIS